MAMHTTLRIAAALTTLSFILVVRTALAGPFESELGTDAAKVAADVKISMMNGDSNGVPSGKGLVPYLKALGGPPKRVGLVSFYAWDHGNKKENSYNFYNNEYTYRVDVTRRHSVDDTLPTSMLAAELHDAGIGALKEEFAAVGMQLLTPAEFLDTAEKKQAYESIKVEAGGMDKLFGLLQSKDEGIWQWGVPGGYRLIKLTTVNDPRGNNFALATTGIGVAKVADSVGYDLAKNLGLDAVVILYNVVQAEPTTIRLRGSYLYMFGPNPVADTGQGSYWRGQQYSGVYLRTDVDFIKTDKKGNLVEDEYAGYAIVARAIGSRMAQHVKKKSE